MGNATASVYPGASVTESGLLSGSGSLTVTGGGTLTLGGANRGDNTLALVLGDSGTDSTSLRKIGNGTTGPVTKKIQDVYHEAIRGKVKKYAAGGLASGHKSADGVAKKGHTKGKEVTMKKGGKC